MYVKVKDGHVQQYPYAIELLRSDNPNTSFPKELNESALNEYGVFSVGYQAQPSYDKLTQKVEHSSEPVLVDDKWVITKTVVELTAEQKIEISDKINAEAARKNRDKRDKLLAESDWVTVKAVDQNAQDGLGIQVPQVWLDYRQALRDITNHANFPSLEDSDWPVAP